MTTCRSNDAKGMRDLNPKYDNTDSMAITVKTMAPARYMLSIQSTYNGRWP
jgi:hypothetical protein